METKNIESGKELIHKLIAGSQAIDRMRHEIDLVVGSLLGLLELTDPQNLTVRDDAISWRLSTEWGSFTHSWVKPFVHALSEENGQVIYHLYSGANAIQLKNVHLVHASLPCFVSRMIKHFPQLNDAIQPLLDTAAADENTD